MEGLTCWGKPMSEVLKQLRIIFCHEKEPVRNARVLFFSAKNGSVREEIACILWRHFILKELRTVSSFMEAHRVFCEARLKSEERTEAFYKMLSFVSSKEEAITVYQYAPKKTPEHIHAETKLAEFE